MSWFYRVNSVFYDPSIYGRFLVVAIVASVALVLFERSAVAWLAAALAAATMVGLVPSFSAVELRRPGRRHRRRGLVVPWRAAGRSASPPRRPCYWSA